MNQYYSVPVKERGEFRPQSESFIENPKIIRLYTVILNLLVKAFEEIPNGRWFTTNTTG